ncbi:membrane protein [Pseudomonas tohonis]|uniref:Membrane protein n=1 Tax=Pseudomonas tohonis TaxID=2725477 RepID=A0A6J4E9U4_9PSED|nr:tripartite tricarboxylate transporter TctB family protein [Pseudomonas tohonis]BCG26215.1 membrane protein [Pseudomonas tohonis]GJN51052.1 membrane protein [Pseudomonas tohonis]
MLFQRLFSLGWLAACLVFAVLAWDYHAAFSYEPVGPRAFPLLMLGLMAAALLWLTLRPTPVAHQHDEQPLDAATLRKVAACIALLVVYAGLFEPLGFILSSSLIGVFMARLYGGRWLPSAIAALLISAGLYLLFDKTLDVPLPLGVLDFLE